LLSVIVHRPDRVARLEDTLGDLAGQVASLGGEIVVVSTEQYVEITALKIYGDMIRQLRVDRTGEPAAWEAGAVAASRPTVAFTVAGCRYGPGWAASASGRRGAIVAGPVDLAAGAGRVGRCSYLCDYADFLEDQDCGRGGAAACNVAFDRRTLMDLGPRHGWEKWSILGRGGTPIEWSAALRSTVDPPRELRRSGLAQFRRGRHYAAGRSAGWARAARIAAGAGCLGLPPLRLARVVADRSVRRSEGLLLLADLPCLAALLGCWSLGEMAGYLAGPRNDAS